MELIKIKGIASKFSETIAKILDIDVMIVDDQYRRIADTFHYVKELTPIERYSILGEVMNSGKVIVVQDKTIYKHCKVCKDLKDCKISGMIGVPIFYDEKVIGAISLLIPIDKTSPIFDNLPNSIDFLEKMSDLLSSKLKNFDDYEKLNLIKKEREVIIDMMDNGIVFLNGVGEIMHYNRSFEDFFRIDREISGKNILEVIDHSLIREITENRENFSNRVFFYEHKHRGFFGFLSCRNISSGGKDHGSLLTFKTLGKVYNTLNEVLDNQAGITFEDILAISPELTPQFNKAKELAVTDENILITGDSGLGKSVLARAIHNFSNRENNHFVLIDCENISSEMLEEEIFGRENPIDGTPLVIGKLRMAHKGTLFFKNISQMPLYLQKRLVEVIKTKSLIQGLYIEFSVDIRMIFDTNQDLSMLVKQKRFDEDLYFRISKHHVHLTPLYKRKNDVKMAVDRTIEKMKEKHMKTSLKFDQEVLALLYKYSWPGNINEIERTLEIVISSNKNLNVTLQDVEGFGFTFNSDDKFKTVDEAEKELIEKMLLEDKSKVQIAKSLGIGRATLYRKMKKYGIE